MNATTNLLGRSDPGAVDAARPRYNALFGLILANLALFLFDHVLQIGFFKELYLNGDHPRVWQFVTAMFSHKDWDHLSGNLLFLYMFGRIVEEQEGSFGLLLTYFFTGLAASIASYAFLPAHTISLGASGAIFGIFAVAFLVKLSWDWRNLLEVGILGQFLLVRVALEVQKMKSNDGVDRYAHVGGALGGVALIVVVWFLVRRRRSEG